MALVAGVALITGFLPGGDDVRGELEHAQIVKQGGDAEVFDTLGLLGIDLWPLLNDVLAELEAHEQADEADGAAVHGHG